LLLYDPDEFSDKNKIERHSRRDVCVTKSIGPDNAAYNSDTAFDEADEFMFGHLVCLDFPRPPTFFIAPYPPPALVCEFLQVHSQIFHPVS
jgi:hypothetical protein